MRSMKIQKLLAVASAVAAFSTASAVQAAVPASNSFAVRLTVAESCEINASEIFVNEGNGMSIGSVFEACNTQEGFQVVAQHRWLEANEQVAVNYAGQASFLRNDGWSPVATRLGAKFGTRVVSVRHTGLTAPLAIGLTITAF